MRKSIRDIAIGLLAFRKRLAFFAKAEHIALFPGEITESLKIPRSLALSEMALQLSNRRHHEVLPSNDCCENFGILQ